MNYTDLLGGNYKKKLDIICCTFDISSEGTQTIDRYNVYGIVMNGLRDTKYFHQGHPYLKSKPDNVDRDKCFITGWSERASNIVPSKLSEWERKKVPEISKKLKIVKEESQQIPELVGYVDRIEEDVAVVVFTNLEKELRRQFPKKRLNAIGADYEGAKIRFGIKEEGASVTSYFTLDEEKIISETEKEEMIKYYTDKYKILDKYAVKLKRAKKIK